MKALPLLFIALVPLAGCGSAPARPTVEAVPVRGDGLAGIGQPTRAGALVVTPIALVEDSRCPVNVHCIWAGRVVLRARIDGAGWRETRLIELGQTAEVHGARLALVSVAPARMAGDSPPAGAYLFGFEER